MVEVLYLMFFLFFFSSRRRHTRCGRDWSSDVCSSDLDYEGLMFLANHLKSLDSGSPYFAFFFTGTTHEPFPNPGSEFHVFPHGENQTHNYLNTLRYSDWSIQQFMQKMQELPT